MRLARAFPPQLAFHLAAGGHLGRGDEQEEQFGARTQGEHQQQVDEIAGRTIFSLGLSTFSSF